MAVASIISKNFLKKCAARKTETSNKCMSSGSLLTLLVKYVSDVGRQAAFQKQQHSGLKYSFCTTVKNNFRIILMNTRYMLHGAFDFLRIINRVLRNSSLIEEGMIFFN